ncbi:integrase core domain-containing protein [Candidatus Cryosericum septentrionale]|uniref:integrase core domain-containing protein n=1 Tax=Candidatus Cryosericum septentrionale TaxID=2290913 RepID=UPI001A9E2631|nr:integrase core domain-containing protein [Candidatus Cryosericum septentrionale]
MSFRSSASASRLPPSRCCFAVTGSDPHPAAARRGASSLEAQASGIIACDFFTIETALLKTLYVGFFIEIGTRRVHVTAATSNPDSVFVAQQARNLAMSLSDEGARIKFLIRDRDAKFSRSFDDVFATEGTRVVCTPIRAPNANAFAERWVATLRTDCLDWLLVLGPRHLDRVLRIYVEHYNQKRPHRGLQLLARESAAPVEAVDSVPDRSAARSSRWAHPRVQERGVIEYLHPTLFEGASNVLKTLLHGAVMRARPCCSTMSKPSVRHHGGRPSEVSDAPARPNPRAPEP